MWTPPGFPRSGPPGAATGQGALPHHGGGTGPVVLPRRAVLGAAAALVLTGACFGVTRSLAPISAGPAAGTRDPLKHPFAADSFWNTAMGSGATFESWSSPRTRSFLSGDCYINCEEWSIPVVMASAKDKVSTVVTSPTWVWTYRVPRDAQVALGTDGHSVIAQPDSATAYENWVMSKVTDAAWTSRYQVRTNLRGSGGEDGVRAAGVSGLGGLIRAHEVAALSIPHALALAIPRWKLRLGHVWPATRQDDDADSTYSGPIPMGTLAAVPPTVDLDSLGLSAEGLALARALQDYGAYVVDAAGGTVLYAEPAAAGEGVDRLREDFPVIREHMRVVTNSSPATVGGGGNRRRPSAAPLA